jgi:hypothetical protein
LHGLRVHRETFDVSLERIYYALLKHNNAIEVEDLLLKVGDDRFQSLDSVIRIHFAIHFRRLGRLGSNLLGRETDVSLAANKH